MTSQRIEALRKQAAGMDDQAEKVVLECLEEIERQHACLKLLSEAMSMLVTDTVSVECKGEEKK